MMFGALSSIKLPPRWLENVRRMPRLWIRPFSRPSPNATVQIINEPIDEQLLPNDRLQYFHATHPGQILDGRFKTIVKLGFGGGSTVWLAENLEFKKWAKSSGPRYVSIKIAALDTDASREAKWTKLILNANPSHEGLSCIRTPIDEFQLQEQNGAYSCLVYEPMRETLFRFQRRLPRQRLGLPLFKAYMFFLLQALDYLHAECHLIHTDIKDENIMVTMEEKSVLTDFASYYKSHPQPRHMGKEDGRVTYLSRDEFGPLRGSNLLPRLADFNLCFPGLPDGRGHLSAIQSHRYRAPEVLLGCPWSYSVDIWNLGLIMWNLLEDTSLFNRPAGEDGEYDAHVHLAQMVSLLGNPPEALVERERICRKAKLGSVVVNQKHKECETMNEFWGGPFFDDDGHVLRRDLVKEGNKLTDTVTELTGDEKEQFLDFATSMLQWLPEKRKTAKELLQHSFFNTLHEGL